MEIDELKHPTVSGTISAILGAAITYGFHSLITQSADIQWALIAVVVASFFSGFFSTIYNE